MPPELTTIFMQAAPWVAAGTAAVATIMSGWYTTQQGERGLVKFMGKYVRSTGPGFALKIPFLESVEYESTQRQQLPDHLEIKTQDDIFVSLPVNTIFEVQDPALFRFEIQDPEHQIKTIVNAAVRKVTAGLDSQDLYSKREEINEQVLHAISAELQTYGVKLMQVVIDEPKFPAAIQQAYNDVRASERRRQAAVNDGEAAKINIVKKAEGEAEADALRGKGEAQRRVAVVQGLAAEYQSMVTGGMPPEFAFQAIMRTAEFATLREVAGEGSLVIDNSNGGSAGEFMRMLKAYGDKVPANDSHRTTHAAPAAAL